MKPALVVALVVACIVLSRTSSFAGGGVAHGPAFEGAGRSEHLRNFAPTPEAPALQTPALNPIPGPLPPPQQPRNSCLSSQGTWSAC